MSVLGLPLDLPVRVVERALDDLRTIARVASEMPARLDALDARAEGVMAQLDQALAIGEAINARAEQVLLLGDQIDARGKELLAMGERLVTLGENVQAQGDVIADRAREVAERGADVAAALPTIQRAVGIAEPLEGAVERLGRIVDRFPGGRGRGGETLGPPD